MLLVVTLGVTALVACGGSDDNGSGGIRFPRFAGADELASVDLPQEDLEDIDANVVDGESTLLRSDAPFDEVREYYAEGVEDDGWVVTQSVEIDDEQELFVVSNDRRVAAVYVLSGEAAVDGEELFADEGLEFDPDDVEAEDTVILVSHFTCQESSVAECLAALAP